MTENDISKIKVGKFTVSVVGMGQAMEELAKQGIEVPDDDVRSFMLERLKKSNYIPKGAEEDYGNAFVREFRKSLGQAHAEEHRHGLEVKVLGAGCSQCRELSKLVMDVLNEINLPAEFDHVTDMREIARYGVMGSPALLINGRAVSVGSVPPRERIKRWLTEANAANR